MGELILQKHLRAGVSFLSETEVLAIRADGSGSTVKLTNGQELKAGLVVGGIGIQPSTAFLRNVPRNDDQSLSVDSFMRVLGVESVYAAGDLVNFPLAGSNQRVRIEHWRVAQQQAKTAAASMMDLECPYEGIPYFWTYHYGVRYEFFGQIPQPMELYVDGDLEQPKFIAAYLAQDGRCTAFFAANRESETASLLDYMGREGPPSSKTFEAMLKAA
jgi:NADPH-dependent 2,4-dienoyl-CoA reductase/sulfur reductase-like enzyme